MSITAKQIFTAGYKYVDMSDEPATTDVEEPPPPTETKTLEQIKTANMFSLLEAAAKSCQLRDTVLTHVRAALYEEDEEGTFQHGVSLLELYVA